MSKSDTFIDFALHIMFEPDNGALSALDNKWKIALNSSNPAIALQILARKEGFNFTIAECQNAIDAWNKFMELNQQYAGGGPAGPVTY